MGDRMRRKGIIIKKILNAFFLILILQLFCSISLAESSGDWGKLTWKLDDNGTLTISGTGEMNNFVGNDYVEAWQCNKDKIIRVIIKSGITSIGAHAFDSCYNVTSISIPNTVTNIGEKAFFCCENLPSIQIPDGVTKIHTYAFVGCIRLAKINVSEGNTKYSSDDGVLFSKEKDKLIKYPQGKENKSYIVPDTVKNISESAFVSCEKLTNITISNNVTNIATEAFCGCNGLTTITIPAKVTHIGLRAFYLCSKLNSINVSHNNAAYLSDNGVLFNKSKTLLLQYPTGKADSSYTIPEGVECVGEIAFYNSVLRNIIIPNSVICLKNSAFMYCVNLEKIIIPSSVTTMENSVFFGCGSLKSVLIPDSVIDMEWGIFQVCKNVTVSVFPNSYALNYAKENGVAYHILKTISIPEDLVSISSEMFQGIACEAIIIPDGCRTICSNAFANCKKLIYVYIPSSVTFIAEDAFVGSNNVYLDQQN